MKAFLKNFFLTGMVWVVFNTVFFVLYFFIAAPIIIEFGAGRSLDVEEGMISLLGNFLDNHCKDCDISEGDVYNQIQAIAFNYYGGIRSVYYMTPADSYMDSSGRRKWNGGKASSTAWENHLSQYGYLRGWIL